MAKARTEYVCRECGAKAVRWSGRCPECQAWSTLEEKVVRATPAVSANPAARPRMAVVPGVGGAARPLRLAEIDVNDFDRLPVGIEEFGRVLGGGIVRGSLVLIGGDPGVGKSTLLAQVCDEVAKRNGPALYISGEESLAQIGLRARRLGLDAKDLLFASDTDLGTILETIENARPSMVVVDSIQSIYSADVESSPGSVSQLRECTLRLMQLAKGSGVSVFLIGHVTKEGALAGPKMLEHMVDTVLYLEGERYHTYRLLRGTKNRFGPTHEVGVFEMRGEGMVEVANPSAAFLSERGEGATGSSVLVTMEGTRPLLVEVQALASRSSLAVPRRAANGIENNRLLLVSAVLGRRLGLPLHDQDLYVNVIGGLRIDEPAADLAVALSIVSSFRDRQVDPRAVVAGEIGLSGELRSVGQLEIRLREAAKLGFERAVVPRSTALRSLKGLGLDLMPAGTLREAINVALRE
ncbi:MAG TPA: DNA repair protein RadA [Solirubrobacterales bacterium]|nr:DNA repair protein RadA [Solirubrobacterales bacterium]